MKTRTIIQALLAAGVLAGTAAGFYALGKQQSSLQSHLPSGLPTAPANTKPASSAADKKVLYWHDPMVPGQKFDKPGKSPFMDMQLVPVYADTADTAGAAGDAGGEGKVSINPRVQQNLGIRTAEVSEAALGSALAAVGTVAYNERELYQVQARSNGFVEKLHVRATLDHVKKGQPLADLYVPDWVAAQEEFLGIRAMQGKGQDGLLDAARQRLRLTGMNEAQIRQVDSSGKLQTRITITAPADGVITELTAREGMAVTTGAPLFRINGVGTVWVNAEVPENAVAQLQTGQIVEARTTALPSAVLTGRLSAIVPQVNAASRTVVARMEVSNPSGKLLPGMFVNVNLGTGSSKPVLQVPTEAIIQTGKRNLVMLVQGDGRFLPVDVETGQEAKGQTEIRKGLVAGQKVVVSGQFLVDSEASLKGTGNRMGDKP